MPLNIHCFYAKKAIIQQKLEPAPGLRRRGQPLQVEKVLTDNLSDNGVLWNQDAKKTKRTIRTTRAFDHIRMTQQGQGERRTALTAPPKPKAGLNKVTDQFPDTVTNKMVPSFLEPSRPSDRVTNRACQYNVLK